MSSLTVFLVYLILKKLQRVHFTHTHTHTHTHRTKKWDPRTEVPAWERGSPDMMVKGMQADQAVRLEAGRAGWGERMESNKSNEGSLKQGKTGDQWMSLNKLSEDLHYS